MKKNYIKIIFVMLVICAVILPGCGKKEAESETKGKQEEQQKKSGSDKQVSDLFEETEDEDASESDGLNIEGTDESEAGEDESQNAEEPAGDAVQTVPQSNGITIVIDPGHSSVVEDKQEPIGPGAAEYKSGDTYGTSGVATGIPEYVFTLNVAYKLKAELEARGYTIVMTRDSNDVPRSCVERAEIMNSAGASACVRIHANGSENQAARGAMTICTTPSNPFVPHLYEQSRRLSDCILNQMVSATGCISEGVWETDTMSGNNWSQIPVTIVETGYMTNPEEDVLLSADEYQNQIVQGIANGVDEFIGF